MRQPLSVSQDLIQAEHIRTLYNQTGAAVFVHVFDALVLIGLIWSSAPSSPVIAWGGLIAIAVLARLGIAQRYHRRKPPASQWRLWARISTLSNLVFGGVWGLASVLFLDIDNPVTVAVLVCIIVGMNAGAASINASYTRSYFIFMIASYVPMIAVLAIGGGPTGIALSLLSIMSVLANTMICLNTHKTVDRALRLRFENELLHKQAAQANAAKTRFLAAASHDLRQPIHALNLSFAALTAQYDNPATSTLISQIEHSIEAVDTMLDTLLDISKLDAGVVSPKLEPISAQALFDDICNEFQATAAEHGNRLTCRPSSALVRSDIPMLKQILHNLVGNALRYTSQGRVLVAARRRGDALRIEVHDTGVGIPADRIDEIFVEFQQLGNPHRDHSHGLGLGLAIVRRLADLLGHRIDVYSIPGRGSCFAVTLPLTHSSPTVTTTVTAPDATTASVRLQECRILILDDQPIVLTSMTHLLEHWGCRVSAASTIEQAKAQCRSEPPDLLIVDYQLADDLTGLQAIDRLRALIGSAIPALVVTGDTSPERLREAEASGYPLLHKPAQPRQLRATIEHLLNTADATHPAQP